jgi:hypothetical protein
MKLAKFIFIFFLKKNGITFQRVNSISKNTNMIYGQISLKKCAPAARPLTNNTVKVVQNTLRILRYLSPK